MNLTQIKSLVDTKTYFSRSDEEAWAAINAAARLVYQAVLKEYQGYWLKTDTTSVVFQDGTNEYDLPADVQQLLRIRERRSPSESWRVMQSAGLMDDAMQQQFPAVFSFDSQPSDLHFFGPYLSADAAEDPADLQIQSIQIAPGSGTTRMVELTYVAKYTEVLDQDSYLMIPDDGRDAVVDLAASQLLQANDDSMGANYAQTGQQKLNSFLTLVRDRQVAFQRTVEPYLEDLD